jgi:hypothetical protein
MGRRGTPGFVEIPGEAEPEAGSQRGKGKEESDDADRKNRIREIRETRG